MLVLTLLSFLICPTLQKEPILTLSLTLSDQNSIETTFAIGSSSIPVSIDLNYNSVDVCCKNTDTLARRIFYFMANPFFQMHDYSCKSEHEGRETDIAVFEKIGPLNVSFNQIVYPKCTVGRLGFGKSSEFLGLMPATDKFFVIEGEKEGEKGQQWKLVVGGKLNNEFNYFGSLQSEQWQMGVQAIRFNGIPFNSADQKLTLISDHYHIAIPSNIYSLVQHQLTTNFDCITKDQTIYCPCAGGISTSFPDFKLQLSDNYAVNILQTSYLQENDQVCSSMLSESTTNNWQVNILLFDSVDLLFDYDQQQIGVANHRITIEKNELIEQPMQIILNSAVILLLCFFIAMVLIELIKYLTGIEEASNESFENYMLKRAE